ncbi:spike base protein, RCAP_Rcc01079 family [Rhizorhapis suberifaciens]|uniref:Uncharacterized protein n=1 Tax=Rhizorhapis suberifaciens TaxID=13656 RepID=A0A840HVP5_9SPHN|nr:hypothetical protein [Rhizorhapis suberifaciens]MBB4642362.1 hypothetical protein [Rhizorhapis suberifaciens]
MADTFTTQMNKTNPATTHFAVVPDDEDDFAIIPRAIYCQEAGTAQIVDAAGTVLPYTMTAGQVITFRGVRINATSTTGTYYGWY